MVEIVHLKTDQRPPQGKKYLLVECVSDRSAASLTDTPAGLTIRVQRSCYAEEMAGLLAKAETSAMDTIYVRGAPMPTEPRQEN